MESFCPHLSPDYFVPGLARGEIQTDSVYLQISFCGTYASITALGSTAEVEVLATGPWEIMTSAAFTTIVNLPTCLMLVFLFSLPHSQNILAFLGLNFLKSAFMSMACNHGDRSHISLVASATTARLLSGFSSTFFMPHQHQTCFCHFYFTLPLETVFPDLPMFEHPSPHVKPLSFFYNNGSFLLPVIANQHYVLRFSKSSLIIQAFPFLMAVVPFLQRSLLEFGDEQRRITT